MYEQQLRGIWNGMKNRCSNPNNPGYKWYGGRGIYVCKEWLSDFKGFYTWSISSGYKPGLTIDRIDNDGPYSPDNCQWLTRASNASKTRNHNYIDVKPRDIPKEHLEFVSKIASYKKEHGLTNYDLGEMTGYANDTICAFMCGKRPSKKLRKVLESIISG